MNLIGVVSSDPSINELIQKQEVMELMKGIDENIQQAVIERLDDVKSMHEDVNEGLEKIPS